MRRRELLKGAAAALPLAAVGMASPAAAQPAADLVGQLLTLKHVQAEFYRQGNARGLVTGTEAGFLAHIGEHKQAHVAALSQAITAPPLSSTPPPPPAVRFDQAFTGRDAYLDAAYRMDDAIVRLYMGLPAESVSDSLHTDLQLLGITSADARALAVLGVLTGRPVVGGVLTDPDVPPLALDDVLGVFSPFLASAADAAESAGVTQ